MTRDTPTSSTSRKTALVMAGLLGRIEIMRRAEEQASELRNAEGRLLRLLTQRDAPLTLKQIAHELELEQSTANRQVNAALRDDHVRRFREPGATAWLFEPTEQGCIVFERSLNRHLDRVRGALDAVPEADRADLLDALATFVDAYGERGR